LPWEAPCYILSAMRILLIYPRYGYHHRGGLQEPLGIIYVADALENAGHEVEVLDLTFSETLPDLSEILSGVDMVGVSSSSALYGRALETLRAVKGLAPDLPVVLGGPHATALPEKAVSDGFDAAVIGEGELSSPLLARAIGEGAALSGVPGVAYSDGGKICVNLPTKFIENLDSLPHPDRSRLDYESYFAGGMGQAGVVAMRGCPYRCSYCKPMQEKLFGNKIRRRSPLDVALEVDEIARGVCDRVLFRDDAFTTHSPEWFRKLGRRFREMNTPLWGWVCQGRVDQITPELLDAMQEAGLRMIAFGVESGSQKILNYYKKGITVEQTEKAFEMCRERNIGTHAFVMVGAPEETAGDVQATMDLLERIRPNSVSPSITTPAPGTELYEMTIRDKTYNIGDWSETDYFANSRPLKLHYLTEAQIVEAREKMALMGVGYGVRTAPGARLSGVPRFPTRTG